MDSQEFFGTLLPIQKEDEQKYIAYIFKYPEEIHVLHVDQLYDDVCKRLYTCIDSIVREGLKVEKDILYAYAQKVEADLISIMSEQSISLSNFVLGSYAQQMLNKSNVPVLIVHPKEVFVMGSFRTQGSAY